MNKKGIQMKKTIKKSWGHPPYEVHWVEFEKLYLVPTINRPKCLGFFDKSQAVATFEALKKKSDVNNVRLLKVEKYHEGE